MGSWRQAGRILQGLRERRGWEVPRLAAELTAQATSIGQTVPGRESLIRMIYEWEAGTHRPRAYYVLFVLVYATDEELAARTIQRGSELDRLMAALKAMGVPVNRRQFLLNAAALAGGVAGVPAVAANLEGQERVAWVLKHPRSVDLQSVAYLCAQALDLMRQYEAVASPTALLPQAAERVEQVTLLREHAPLGRVRQELHRLEAQAATLMGRLVWDVSGQRDHATAARYYDQAIAAASNVREGWAEAFPRMFQRFNPVSAGSTDLRTGLELAQRASARAQDGSSHVVAGWSLGFTAEAHALLGEERNARLALDRADFHLAKAAADDPMFGVFAREQLGGFVGACHLHLRDPRGALLALRESARTLGAGKEKHKSVVLGDVATALVLGGDPDGIAPSPRQVRAAILAYAAGDALGVPWEGKTPEEVDWEALEELPARGDWPRGSTSDDTDQLLVVARYLAETNGQVDERQFLTRLAKALPGMRGVGPTTRAAVRRFVETGELQASKGSSIGAAMRALPFGWTTPVAARAQRRELTVRLSRTTHGAPAAIMSACVVAEMAAWAIEQHPVDAVVAAGLDEAEHMTRWYGLHSDTMQPLRQAASGTWGPYRAGMALDAVATVASVMLVLREPGGLATAMKRAVSLGGDTDTAAAIVGGILGAQAEDVDGEISWLARVRLPEPKVVEATAARLCELRESFHR